MFYKPEEGHKLPHDPFKAIVAPRPIGWISSQDEAGNINLAPYSFFNAISDQPPMVIFSATGRKSRETACKDSIYNVQKTGEFVVNIVSSELLNQMNLSSGIYPKEINEFELAKLSRGKSQLVKPPFVMDSPAALECKLFKFITLPGENNILVIGTVIGIHINDKFIKNGLLDLLSYKPIGRLGYRDYTEVMNSFPLNRPNQK